MKNIIKVLAVILALAMMTVFATSCGSNKKDKDTSSKFSFDKFDEDDVDFDEDYDLEDGDEVTGIDDELFVYSAKLISI